MECTCESSYKPLSIDATEPMSTKFMFA